MRHTSSSVLATVAASRTTGTAVTTHQVLDRAVQVPMTVDDAVGGLTVVAGDADVISSRLPADLRPVRLPGGRGIVLLLAVHYLDSPLGDYDEVVVGLAARPHGSARVGAWIEHMAVSQSFTRAAGEQIWGYPKTLDELAFDHGSTRASCSWARDGREILRIEQPTTGRVPAPPLPVTTFTRMDGRTMATSLRADARGVGVRARASEVELGDHPVADDLRELGVGGRPLAAAWLSHVRMRFEDARPLRS